MTDSKKAMTFTRSALAIAVFMAGCGPEAVRRTAPKAEEQFAREFVRVLRDSGSAAAITRAKRSTQALPGLGPSLDTLRQVMLLRPQDSLLVEKWRIEHETGKPNATLIEFAVTNLGEPFRIGLWIEREDDRLVAETIYFGPPKS